MEEDELAGIAREIFGDSRSSSPILKDGLASENGGDSDVGKYMTFSEEETDIKIEIKNDDVLSMTAEKNEPSSNDFLGFECSFDPNAFEIVDEQCNDNNEKTEETDNSLSKPGKSSNSKLGPNVRKKTSNAKQKRRKGRRTRNELREETCDIDDTESSDQPERQRILDDINNSLGSTFDDGSLTNLDSVETRSKSSKESPTAKSSTKPDNPPAILRVNLRRLTHDKSSDEKEEELPLKRTRRKTNFGDSTSTVTTSSENELEMGYRILKQLISFPGSTPFLDRPDATAHGMNNYFMVVKKPMWLKLVLKRYNDDKYPSITELVADIRLVLENCYLYWGAGDPLTKKALRVEELLEKKLATLPSHVRDLCSLNATHGEDPSEKSEENKTDEQQDEGERSCQILKKNELWKGKGFSGIFISRLMQRVVNSSETESNASDTAVVEHVGREIEEWERTVLYRGGVEDEISSMWELPLIGHFLYLTLNILNIGQISQFEIERMLLIPQTSTALAKVMTSMLIAPFSRARLEEAPPMPYEVWTSKLKKKVAQWYRTYRGTGDQTVKVFELTGIDPEFWLVMGENNPLDRMEFHQLRFIQRVWILKSLCEFLLHNHKSFQETFNNIESEDLRESYLGRDKQGFTYHYFPEFSEVRVYKRARVPDKKWSDFNSGVEEMIISAAEDVEYSEDTEAPDDYLRYKLPRSMLPSPKSFRMVAKCVEDVRCLVDELVKASTQNRSPLVRNLLGIVSELEPIESKLESQTVHLRKKMHKEWLDIFDRPIDYVDPGSTYWSKKEDKTREENENAENVDNVENPSAVEKRERRSTRENQRYAFEELEKHLGPEEEGEDYVPVYEGEDSEDEWVATPSKKRKKQQNVSQRKIKKLQSLTQKIQDKSETDDNTSTSGAAENSNAPKSSGNSGAQENRINDVVPNQTRVKEEPQELSQVQHSKLPPPPPAIPLPQHPRNVNVKQEGKQPSLNSTVKIEVSDDDEYLDYSSINVKSELSLSKQTVMQLKGAPKASANEVINLLSDDEDEATDVVPVFNDVKPVIKTIECFVNFPGDSQKAALAQSRALQQQNMQTQFLQKKAFIDPKQVAAQASSPQQMQTQFQQLLPQPGVVFQQRNMVQLPQKPAPGNSLMQQLVRPPVNVKQEPGTVAPTQPTQFNSSTSPQLNRMRSPQVRGSPPGMLQSPRGRPRMMMSPRMPAPMTQRSPMTASSMQQRGRMPNMAAVGRGSPQNMRQRSPQTFPQRGLSPQVSSPFGSPSTPNRRMQTPPNRNLNTNSPASQMQARRNLNFNSPGRPATSNSFSSPSRTNNVQATNSNDNRTKERLHIINTGGVFGKNTKTVEGKLVVALNDDGNYGYFVTLSDGGKVTLTMKQINDLRSKCNGSLPDKVGIPMVITD